MNRVLILVMYAMFAVETLNAQCNSTVLLNQNNITTDIHNNEQIFWDLNDNNIQTIFAASLWVSGFKPSGNLGLAAVSYPNSSSTDYWAGPINENTGLPFDDNCQNYNQFWQVFGYEIEQHIQDFSDDGVIDNQIQNIFGYPAHGNTFFESIHGFTLPDTPQKLASFFDSNNDGIYSPDLGDYPLPSAINNGVIPAQIVFSIFNDAGGAHTSSGGEALRIEIQYTAWTFNCMDNEILNNTIFTNHKIINRSGESLDSLQVGIWVDYNIGCNTDDFLGCSPENNSFYGYNRDSIDGTIGNLCNGAFTFLGNPPAQSVTFLNQEMSHFMYCNAGNGDSPIEILDPSQPDEYYNYLSGSFRDGTPLTFGGSGFNSSSNITNFAFPANPSDSLTEWTMHDFFLDSNIVATFTDSRAIGSIEKEIFSHGSVIEIDIAHTLHQEEDLGNIGNINLMYGNLPLIQQMYNDGFENHCTPDFMLNTNSSQNIELNISPNPTNGILNINFENQTIDQLSIFDTFGNVLFEKNGLIEKSMSISTIDFPSGIYFLQIKKENTGRVEKFVVVH